LARRLGLCGNALDILSPKGGGSSLPLIVSDIIDDERFKNRPFVTSHPSARFYAAMPIRGKSGSNIGAIEVIDERPREGLSEAEIEFLGDVALAIMAHLEMTRSQEGERRSEKMIKGLGVFMKGRTDLQDWWLELGNNKPRKQQDASAGGEPEGKGRETEDYTSVTQGHALSSKHGTGEAAVSGSGSSSLPFPDSNPSKATLAGFNAGFPVDRPLVSTPVEYTDATATSRPVSQKHLPKSAQSTQETTAGADVESPMPHRGHSASTTFTSDFQDSLISGRLKEMFCRAGHIIQESIEVDGALFLDASISTLSERSGESSSTRDPRLHYESSPEQEFRTSTDGTSTEKEHSPTAETSGPDSASNNNANQGSKETSTGRRSGEEVPCGILGLWTSEHSSLHGDLASTLRPLTESFLQSLLHKYPQGHVFSPVEQCTPPRTGRRHHFKESAERAEADTICRMLPGTRSIAFVPLWDQNRGRWFAGGFMWTVLHTERVLTHARDLNYLAAFGNSIMAEVARLDVVGADRAKSDFISSISHELRSPLHGILASVELLHDTTVDLFQYGMIDTIERCGRTLLDTIQHVLDFAKINTFTRSKNDEAAEARPSGRPSLLGMPSLSVNIDLSLLVEDVFDSVFAGHEFQGNSSFLVTDGASGFPPKGLRRNRAIRTQSSRYRNEHGQKRERIDVVVDIVWRPNWIFSTESGALRRVLMNLFGNALKYTDRGCVKVSLQATDIEVSRGHCAKSIITLTVSDTGRGIDQEYLHNGLFTPFTQENPLNPGTGLGLSIVLQIVRSLGGRIDITSEVGVGTEVMVTFTMNQAPSSEPRHLDREGQTLIQSVRDKTKGLVIGLVGLDVEPSIPTRDPSVWQGDLKPSLFLHASIESAAREWFGMQATPPSTWQLSPPNIYVANE
jgi:signal transduction histidine kinase